MPTEDPDWLRKLADRSLVTQMVKDRVARLSGATAAINQVWGERGLEQKHGQIGEFSLPAPTEGRGDAPLAAEDGQGARRVRSTVAAGIRQLDGGRTTRG